MMKSNSSKDSQTTESAAAPKRRRPANAALRYSPSHINRDRIVGHLDDVMAGHGGLGKKREEDSEVLQPEEHASC